LLWRRGAATKVSTTVSNARHVVFGSGPVGRTLIDELLARGRQVRLVKRSGKAEVPPEVEVVKGDATDPQSTREVCRGAAVVYNCTSPKDYHRWPEQFPPLVYGVAEGAAASGARLVAMDNLYMYGPTGGQPMTEETPHRGRGSRSTTRVRMARYLHDLHASGKVQVAVGRASDFFGPRVVQSTMGEQNFRAALAGKRAQVLGRADVPHTFTYMPDIGRALALLGERDEAVGEVWHIPSPETVTPHEFLRIVYEESGQPLKYTVVNLWMMRAMELFAPALRGMAENYYQFTQPYILDSSKFTRTFGMSATPLREAIRQTLAWCREHPPQG
jgi:nucleoside-diphosphate-sugar epimerase